MRTKMDRSAKQMRPCVPLAVLMLAGATALLMGGCGHSSDLPPVRPEPVSANASGPPATSPAAVAAAGRVQEGARIQQIQANTTMTPQQKQEAIQSLEMQSGQQAPPN